MCCRVLEVRQIPDSVALKKIMHRYFGNRMTRSVSLLALGNNLWWAKLPIEVALRACNWTLPEFESHCISSLRPLPALPPPDQRRRRFLLQKAAYSLHIMARGMNNSYCIMRQIIITWMATLVVLFRRRVFETDLPWQTPLTSAMALVCDTEK